jgi:hypothetical protein
MTKIKKLNPVSKILFGLVNFAAFGTSVFAQDTAPATPTSPASVPTSFSVSGLTVTGQHINNVIGEGKNPVGTYIVRLINVLSLMIGSVAFLAIVVGGFLMLTSGGKEQQITKGKDAIKYAVIGLVVAFSAYFITSYVQSTFYDYGTTAK